VNSFTLTIGDFFTTKAGDSAEYQTLLLNVFREKAGLRISFSSAGVELSVTNQTASMVIGAGKDQKIRQVALSADPNILLPVALNVSSIELPHSSILFSGRHGGSIGNMILLNVFSHLLRKKKIFIEQNESQLSDFSNQYFYFLRWLFPNSFSREENEYERSKLNLIIPLICFSDPLLEESARRIRLICASVHEKVIHAERTEDLLLLRQQMMDVI
tara:strand:+ start:126 stop:773 length:648 start_codon:yes stop_codon:yes gene_type:complete